MRLAIYHCSIKIIGRGGTKPRSAVESAAYRSGTKMTNEYDGVTHDYTRKRGVVYSEIVLPLHAPEKFSDRSTLWNSVEEIEKSGNAQLAREIEVSLPRELDREQKIRLVRNYVDGCFVPARMCADFSIHDRQDGKYKSRRADTTDWNDRGKAEEWRKLWADYVNHSLAERGIHETVDHRSYKRQGIEKIPSVHMGAAASQMGYGIVRLRLNENFIVKAGVFLYN